MPKRSRLARKMSGFQMVASLDCFIKKRVMNKIFFMPKRSRLVKKISGPDFECIRKPDKKSVRKVTIRKPDGSVFGGLLYCFIRRMSVLDYHNGEHIFDSWISFIIMMCSQSWPYTKATLQITVNIRYLDARYQGKSRYADIFVFGYRTVDHLVFQNV